MKRTAKVLSLSATLAALLLGANAAQAGKEAYLQDTRGELARNSYGQCWRTGYWTPAAAIAECDSDLVAKPVVAAPTVAPAAPVIAGPAKPALEKVSITADALFDFNKADLKADGKKAFDGVIAKLKADPSIELVLITGHTDRLGSDKYNQKLSERRAQAVANYFAAQGVDKKRIKAEGKGETQPVTKPSDCKGDKKTKALIACLQPDRRVVVEVAAQREAAQ